MKCFFIAAACLCMILLSGCVSNNLAEAPTLTNKFSSDTKLHLDGFKLYSTRATKNRVGSSVYTGYNFRNDSWILGDDSYSETTYERVLDDKFPGIVSDIFESAGANIKTKTHQLTIEGRISDGRYLWDSAAMWYRDVPIFILSVCTLGTVMSKEREIDVNLLVYNKEGKRIKEYKATKQYHTSGVHFPMVFLVADKMRLWYCDRMAATFALTQCVNDFVRDYNNGLFKQPVR